MRTLLVSFAQEYQERPEAAIEAAITLTGTSADSQALPAVENLCQTWPLTGRHIMGLAKSVVCSSPGSRLEYLFHDRTHVAVWTSSSIIVVEASGTAESVAELGQQFAWLGAALRSSSRDSGIVNCTPRVSDIMWSDSTTQKPSSQEAHVKIDFTMNEDEGGDSQGRCWNGVFRNPVVVQGSFRRQLYHWEVGPPKASPGCMLEKVSITAGKIVTGGFTFAVGVKDVPLRVSHKVWMAKIVNDTSALLHLLRAFFEHSSSDKFKSTFLFKREDLREACEPGTADSAIEVLLNPINKALKTYPKKDDFLRFEDQVEKLYDALNKMIDHQIGLAGRHGIETLSIPASLPYRLSAKGWVDFTRTIHAITLFGRGFGDLIRPASPGELCSYWARLPRQKYYLGACVSDLEEIMELDGDAHSNLIKLCDDIFWQNPDITFETCQRASPTDTATATTTGTGTRPSAAKAKAKSEIRNKPRDRAQVLLPTALKAVLPKRTPVPLNDRAAVIFGHNMTFSWIFPDIGSPKKGELPTVEDEGDEEVATEESNSQFRDSGIGSSLISSSPTRGSGGGGVTTTISGSSLDARSSSSGGIHSERTERTESTALEGSSTRGDDGAVPNTAPKATEGCDQRRGQRRKHLQLQSQTRTRTRTQARWNLFRNLVKRRRDMARE
ncbi:hypothetical protein PV04_02385 [Phialophora macrospora]|uniref:Uncharacterized protein n=1 Tax=Phialophora macrospora TaxID=1851006 RepID=A0A0D2E702_9EURO|nr:hypothetical protein PV04_02385 [Phialophora macrospora]